MNNTYLNTVRKIVMILPIIQKTSLFALKGGTAWNLFYDELPRLSLDIDLVYLPINSRQDAIEQIHEVLYDIGNEIMSTMQYRYKIVENKMKLIIDTEDIKIKIEPNLIIRGTINNIMQKELTQTAQNILELNTKMDCLGPEEIIGGKIIACLDRQHPRDIFDIIRIMKLHDIRTQVLMDTIFFYLLQSNRPISELLNPNKKEISKLYENQFVGLTDLEVSLDLLIKTRDELISFMQTEFLNKYKDHIITFIQSKGELSKAYKHFSRFPGIKWKIINLNKMNMSKLHNEISIINKL